MYIRFSRGFAFIVEGPTEKVFYTQLLKYLAQKYTVELNSGYDELMHEHYLWYSMHDEISIVKINVVGTITQIPNSDRWFHSQCCAPYGEDCLWNVFLCYDTDNYKPDITKFYEGDWKKLRESLREANETYDLAASADIEDVMLQDQEGICRFLGCKNPGPLPGIKGKKKMTGLYKKCGKIYHEGDKARDMIKSLDMEKIIKGNLVPLHIVEKNLFQNSKR